MFGAKGPRAKMRFNLKTRFLSCLMAGVFLLTSAAHSYGDFISAAKAGLIASAFVDRDSDGDGLGDTWEINYFGSITAYDGDDDPDADGYDNLWEYQHGTDPTDPGDPNIYFPAKNKALAFLKAMMDRRVSSGKRILFSYIDTAGNTEGFGWTYDNAVSIMAFERAGEWQRAKEVLDAFIWFQDRDPAGDGRIRRAYWANRPIDDLYVGDASPWIPNSNSEASNQAVGDMAFMILTALRYHEYLGQEDSVYLNFAKKLGEWIYDNAKSDSGAGGYNMARRDFEMASPANFDRKATENNIDAYVAFMRLYEALNDHNYRMYALHAKNFVLAMWNSSDGMFWTGTKDDGATINGGANSDVTGYDGVNPTSGQPEDPSTWGLLALGEAPKYGAGITWVENNCKVNNMDGFAFGYDFNADRDGIWFEGMSHAALSYDMLANNAKSDSIKDIILQAQDNNTGGVMTASHNGVTTSFTLWTLGTDLHISAAAWLIFAIEKFNPFWGQEINGAVPYEGGYNDDGDMYIFEDPWAEAEVEDIAPATDGTARAMVDLEGTGGDDKGTFTVADDGIIVKYEWDFDGKGTYDWSSTTTGNVTYWYTDTGSHLARLRVTNDKGFVSTKGVTVNISIADLGAGISPPQASNVTASVIRGTAPLTVTFTGTAADSDGYIAAYEWDFNGDGEYDSYSDSSGDVTYTYREPGAYEPTFRVTDDDSLTDTATLAVEVLEDPAGPKARGSGNAVGRAPHQVTFHADGSTGSITSYEWDFEGDSTYDWSSPTLATAQYTYGEPGTYEARLRVTDTNGVSDTDTVKIRVRHNSSLPAPEAVGNANPSREIIPFDTLFTHSSSVGAIVSYEWDFEGDKANDITSPAIDDILHTYSRPGYYLARLKVRDANGLSHRGYVTIIATGPDQAGAVYSSHIKTPKSGQHIYGNSVTVSIAIAPNKKNQTAQLQEKEAAAAATTWNDINTSVPYPYRTTIDTTLLSLGDHDLRGPVNNIADKAKINLVTIDPVDWVIFEEVNTAGERIKKVKVDKDERTEIELVDGTMATIEPGTLASDDMIIIKVPSGSNTFVNDGVNNILYQRDFMLDSGAAINKPITMVIPYKDADNDGIVDGLGIREENLKLFVHNKTTQKWEAMPDFKVYTDENYVEGTVSHLSVFGLGGGGGGDVGVQAGSSGSSGANGGGGGSRSCFIATATFGTPMAEEVQCLRFFRDKYLLTNAPGGFVVKMYERYSPPIARRIEKNEFLKGAVRHYLRPIITFARFTNVIARRREAPTKQSKKEIASVAPSGLPRNDSCTRVVTSHD